MYYGRADRARDQLYMAVERGADLMDREVLGWWNEIDIPNLEMSDTTACICGQVFAKSALNVANDGFDWAIKNVAEIEENGPQHYGFDFIDEYDDDGSLEMNHQYSILAEEWIRQIEKRRAEKGTMLNV